MNSLIDFIRQFRKNKGTYILLATIVSKLASFLLSVIIIRLLTKEDYGNLMYAYSIVSFLMPFMGVGIFQSFLKYAPIQPFLSQRKALFVLTFRKGLIASVILSLILISLSFLATLKMPGALYYLIFFSVLIISLFIFESVKNYLRVFFLNKAYAKLEIIHSILVLIIGTILTFFLGAFGFIISLVITPLILSAYLLYNKDLLSGRKEELNIKMSKLLSYGVYTSFGGLVAQLIYSVDVLSIGHIIENPDSVAQYKALSIIPFSLMFLPGAIIKTDFVKLVQKAGDAKFLLKYVSNFMMIFTLISLVLVAVFYWGGEWFIQVFFGEQYLGNNNLLIVFVFGVSGAFIFRVLYGNLLVAIGWTGINTVISVVTILADIVLNYYWVHKYGILGAGYATSLLLWASGLATFLVFLVYIRQLKRNNV